MTTLFPLACLLLAPLLFLVLLFRGKGYWAWVTAGISLFLAWGGYSPDRSLPFFALVALFSISALLFGVRPLRARIFSRWILPIVQRALPRMGQTERIALEAGTVGWDGELFSGNPHWQALLDFKPKPLSEKEEEFLKGPTEELCRRLDDWKIVQEKDLPADIWEFIKTRKFFGMIIPESYGGLGFSALAHGQVIAKLASQSITAAVTVMVPNSLGPAELLIHYGTKEQKDYYLPRLACGEEIPCFALTGPEAGSDAASTRSFGIVCRGTYEGREVVGMRLSWNKRYITLAPVATVIGLAFQLYDPDHLLGNHEEIGITCALIPAHLAGIEIGQRHDPMGVPFQNGPTRGENVFVPIDFIIGGAPMAGKGWRMLMECLGAGRGISLPSLAVGGMQLATRVSGAYATIREQFGLPIGRFEGVEEPLARIGGLTYLASGARRLILGAIDAGEKPAILTAIVKAYLTESMRDVVNDTFDILAGAAIMQGPRNLLGQAYKALPIGITVEGANILTRSLIIFGQGAIRCHPFVQKEIQAAEEKNLVLFDRSFFGHVNFVFKNLVRTFLLGFSGAKLAKVPGPRSTRRYFQQLTRFSSAFALVSDAAMGTLGGSLKRREKITGRLADALAWMVLASGALKRFHEEGEQSSHLPYLQWSLEHSLFLIQTSLLETLQNFPNRLVGWGLKWLVFPWGVALAPPSDDLGARVAQGLLDDRRERSDLTAEIFIPSNDQGGLTRLEVALEKIVGAFPLEKKIKEALDQGILHDSPFSNLSEEAFKKGIFKEEERDRLQEARRLREEIIQVDAFGPESFFDLKG